MTNQYTEVFKLFKDDILLSLLQTSDMLFTAMVITLTVGLSLGFILFVTRSDGIYKNKAIYFILSGLINTIRSIPFILFIIANIK